MKNSKLRYFFKEASKCVRKNKLTTFASIGTTVATLFILGIIIILTLNVNSFAKQFSRDCEIQVFISDSLDDAGYDAVGEAIKKVGYVESIEKYTKQQIFEEMRIKLKEKAKILDGLENDNPFRNSFKVKLTDLSKTAEVSKAISKINGVENTTDFREAASYIVKVVNTIKNISLWLVIILCVVSAFIISNAVKVSVYSRRKEIEIMKYIGATDWFIRWPFIIEGMIIGIYGAALTFLIEWLIYFRISKIIHLQSFTILPFSQIALPIAWIFLIVGAFIGAIGSIISIRKHLKV